MVQVLIMTQHIEPNYPDDFGKWNQVYQQDFVDAFTEQDVLKMNIAMRLARLELRMTPEMEEHMQRSQKHYAQQLAQHFANAGEYIGHAMGMYRVNGRWIR